MYNLPPPPKELLKLSVQLDFQVTAKKFAAVADSLTNHETRLKDILDRLTQLTERVDTFQRSTADMFGKHSYELKEQAKAIKGLQVLTGAEGHDRKLGLHDKEFAALRSLLDKNCAELQCGIHRLDEVMVKHVAAYTQVQDHVQERISSVERNGSEALTMSAEQLRADIASSVSVAVTEVEARAAAVLEQKCNTERAEMLKHVQSVRSTAAKGCEGLEVSLRNVAAHVEASNSQHQESQKKLQNLLSQRMDLNEERFEVETNALLNALCITKKQVEAVKDESESVRAAMWMQRKPFVQLRELTVHDCVDCIRQSFAEHNEDVYESLEVLREEMRLKTDKEQIVEIVTSLSDTEMPTRVSSLESQVGQIEHNVRTQYVSYDALKETIQEMPEKRDLETKLDRTEIASVFNLFNEQMQVESKVDRAYVASAFEFLGEQVSNLREVLREVSQRVGAQDSRVSTQGDMDTPGGQMLLPRTPSQLPPTTQDPSSEGRLVGVGPTLPLATIPQGPLQYLHLPQAERRKIALTGQYPCATLPAPPRLTQPSNQLRGMDARALTTGVSGGMPKKPMTQHLATRPPPPSRGLHGGGVGGATHPVRGRAPLLGEGEGTTIRDPNELPLPPLAGLDPHAGPMTHAQVAYLKAIHPTMLPNKEKP